MSKEHKKPFGIKDIAAKAGVSIGTVDRVIHNRGEVKEDTRKKVMEIIQELEYTPNIFAKSLASKKTVKIAIVIPDFSDNNPYWRKPIKGIDMATKELSHYNTKIIFEHFDASDEISFKNVLQKVSDENPDGIVLNPVFKDMALNFLSDFDARNIPYVFFDINLEGVNNLAYFGQDAEKSGRVAARLMDLGTKMNPTLLIVKQANKKIFSQHIESRVQGFIKYFEQDSFKDNVNIVTVEIDLLDTKEPFHSLSQKFLKNKTIDGVFVPNSRSFKLVDFLEAQNQESQFIIGYDLVEENVNYLKNGKITFLISQKPEEQAYKSIISLFNYLLSKKEIQKTNYSPIEIIIRENIEYYNDAK